MTSAGSARRFSRVCGTWLAFAINWVRNVDDALDRAMRMRVVAAAAASSDERAASKMVNRSCQHRALLSQRGTTTVPHMKHRKRYARASTSNGVHAAICRLFNGSSLA